MIPAGATVACAAPAVAEDACPDVAVVFARGTWEPPGVGATGQAFLDALTQRLPNRSVVPYAVDYPASLDFPRAADGVIDGTAKVEAIANECPKTKIVIGGYSQGAAIAGYLTLPAIPPGYVPPPGITGPMPVAVAQHVAAVVLFARPTDEVINLLDRDAPPITIGPSYATKTLDLCVPDDPVCSPTGRTRQAHSSYRFNGAVEQAADYVAARTVGN